MAPDERKTGRVSVRIPAELDEHFTLAAKLSGRSRSDAVRAAVEAFVEAVAQTHDEPGVARRARHPEPAREAGSVRA